MRAGSTSSFRKISIFLSHQQYKAALVEFRDKKYKITNKYNRSVLKILFSKSHINPIFYKVSLRIDSGMKTVK